MSYETSSKATTFWIEGPETAGPETAGPETTRPDLSPVGGDRSGAELRTLRELCHDLTTPAMSIRLLAQVAAQADLEPATRIRLQQIADEAARIAEICGHVLDQAQDPGQAELHVLAEDVADSSRLHYPGVIDVIAETVTAAAHPVVVTRILTNLLDNACRAAGPQGRVRVVVDRDGDQPRLIVADSGAGFGQGKPGKASLGLDIVAALVRRSGGSLRMGAGDLGGLVVTVTFPAADTPGSSAAGGPARREEAG